LLSAAGKPVPFFGARLPALLPENKDLAERLKEVHETIGTIGYFLICAHALAALFHHYVTRDNTLVRMLPGKSWCGPPAGYLGGTRQTHASG